MFAVAVLGIFMSFVDTVRPIENPYLTISKRNAFDLTGEPPPAPKTAPEPPKSEDIKLTGIYRQEGVERAALALIDTKKKAAEPPKYLQLAAGEKRASHHQGIWRTSRPKFQGGWLQDISIQGTSKTFLEKFLLQVLLFQVIRFQCRCEAGGPDQGGH